MSTNIVNGFHERTRTISTSRQDELELVAAAAGGQEHVFGILVERHWRKLLAVTWRITRNREDAQDVAQETFVKAFRYLDRFQGKSSFSTWLTRIAINEALMWLRKRRSFQYEETNSVLEIADSSPTPETNYSQQERALILSEAMKQLTPEVRRTIELRDIRGLSTEATARTLGVSVPAVKARLFHGRKRLRQRLMSRLDTSRIGQEVLKQCDRRSPRLSHRRDQ